MIYDAVNFTQRISEIKEGQIRLVSDTVPNIWWYGPNWGGYSNSIIEYFDIHDSVLYHGNFTKKEFTRQYLESNNYIRQLAEVSLRNSYQWLNNARNNFKKNPKDPDWYIQCFTMYMCRLSQRTHWDFPVLCNYGRWHNGGTRVIATGMTKPDPWNHLFGLELVSSHTPNTILSNSKKITSIKMLHDVLHLDYYNESLDSDEEIVLKKTTFKHDLVHLESIEKVHKTFDRNTNLNAFDVWDNYLSWRTQYPTKPKIKIYTNWPKQVHNQFGAWDVVEIVPSQHIIDEIQGFGGRPGRLERFANEEHRNPKETVDHVLYVVDPRPIELGELLIWMDMEHSTYIESTWKFLLYRKADIYKNTYIDVSYIMQ